jgi:hypothetical protein
MNKKLKWIAVSSLAVTSLGTPIMMKVSKKVEKVKMEDVKTVDSYNTERNKKIPNKSEYPNPIEDGNYKWPEGKVSVDSIEYWEDHGKYHARLTISSDKPRDQYEEPYNPPLKGSKVTLWLWPNGGNIGKNPSPPESEQTVTPPSTP